MTRTTSARAYGAPLPAGWQIEEHRCAFARRPGAPIPWINVKLYDNFI